MAVHFTDKDFQENVIEVSKNTPVLVDFWAPWCGPCRMLGPIVDELAFEYAKKVVIGKVDVDENPQISAQYGIRSIPTIMIFHKGEVVKTFAGVKPKADLAVFLDSLIDKK
jgi:thioredoxin 1